MPMLRKTRRTLAVASLVGALSLGFVATAPAAVSRDAGDRGPRMTVIDRSETLGTWFQALLSRLLTVWAADGSSEVGVGTPTH